MDLASAPAFTIYTEGLRSFTGLAELGFQARLSQPVASIEVAGRYHGVSKAQLQVYLDQFVFRHNLRKTPAVAFQTLLGLGYGHKSTEYEQIREARDLIPNI